MDKLLDWAVFGLTGVVWVCVASWNAGAEYNSTGGTMIVTIFTVMLVSGTTSGGNVFEHIVSGLTGCVAGAIGWIVASVVYTAVTQLLAGGFDVMGIVNGVIGVVTAYFAALLAVSAMNSVRA